MSSAKQAIDIITSINYLRLTFTAAGIQAPQAIVLAPADVHRVEKLLGDNVLGVHSYRSTPQGAESEVVGIKLRAGIYGNG